MGYDPGKHHRHSIRLKDYDYSQPGSYFVTICVHERVETFGKVLDGVMHLNENGNTTEAVWRKLSEWFPHVELDQFVIMPNHMHGIIILTDQSSRSEKPNPPLGQIVRAYKASTARRIRVSGTPGFKWQRNYYEHISRLRHQDELDRMRHYVINNPARWREDSLYIPSPR